MDSILITVVLAVTLPIYPALFAISQRVGRYDVICEEPGLPGS